jgi:hypothetical protein
MPSKIIQSNDDKNPIAPNGVRKYAAINIQDGVDFVSAGAKSIQSA